MNPKEPMSKLHKQVTKWMKDNIATKRTKFLYSHVVDYFCGKAAVDMLMEDSPWATSKKCEDDSNFVFESRDQCVEFLDLLLRYKMFHRAKKVPVTEEKKGKKKSKGESEDLPTESGQGVDGGSDNADSEEKNELKEDKKKKRKIRLDMHLDQIFVDSNDAYVWLYDPIPWYYWIAGGLIVILVIVLCLFPLWPRKLRRGSHWLIWISACFMVGVMCLAVLKYVIFGALYFLSGFKLKFYIFPNLTEDCSFLQSFWPLYKYNFYGEVKTDIDERVEVAASEGNVTGQNNDSDSNESGKSFEFVEKEKCKDD